VRAVGLRTEGCRLTRRHCERLLPLGTIVEASSNSETCARNWSNAVCNLANLAIVLPVRSGLAALPSHLVEADWQPAAIRVYGLGFVV